MVIYLFLILNFIFFFYRLKNKDKNNFQYDSSTSLSPSNLNSFRYYSDIHHVASSIISSLQLQLQPNSQNTLNIPTTTMMMMDKSKGKRSRYICSSADVLSPQFIRNIISPNQILGENKLATEEEKKYIPSIDINSVSNISVAHLSIFYYFYELIVYFCQ